MREWFHEVDLQEQELVERLLEPLKRYVRDAMLRLTGDKLVKANRIMNERVREVARILRQWYGETSPVYRQYIEGVYRLGWTHGAEMLGVEASFALLPKKEIEQLVKAGLVYMYNYNEDMIQLVKKRLALAILNGESYFTVQKDLLKKIPQNGKRRIKVMVRDQIGRVYQYSTNDFLDRHKDMIKEYRWMGPLDKRTTVICRDRQMHNPYTYEDFKRLDPHPHIQCRHGWIAVPKEIEGAK